MTSLDRALNRIDRELKYSSQKYHEAVSQDLSRQMVLLYHKISCFTIMTIYNKPSSWLLVKYIS